MISCGRHPSTEWKPGQSGNPKGKPKGTVHINEAITKFVNMPPEKIQRLKVQVAAALKGQSRFPKVFKRSLDLQIFIAWCAGMQPRLWSRPEYIIERLEPTKQIIESSQRIEEVGKIEIEIVHPGGKDADAKTATSSGAK